MIRIYAGVILGFCLGALSVAFVLWDINPANYDYPQRLAMLAFAVLFGAVGATVADCTKGKP